jgi:1-deoxy-D-xylulose-5-phosphate synthase
MVEQLARHHGVLIIVEEGSVGGFASAVMQHLALRGLLDGSLRVRPLTFPDKFIDHNSPAAQIIEAGVGAKNIVSVALAALGEDGAKGVAVPAQ